MPARNTGEQLEWGWGGGDHDPALFVGNLIFALLVTASQLTN